MQFLIFKSRPAGKIRSAASVGGAAWLRFTPEVEAEFDRYHTGNNILRIRGAIAVACFTWLLFGLIDARSMPDPIRDVCLTVRLATLPLIIGAFLASFWRAWRVRLQYIACALSLTLGLAIVGIHWVARSHNVAVPYERVILATVFFYILIGLRFRFAVFCGWTTFAAYLVAELQLGLAPQSLAMNAIILGLINLMGSFGCYFLERAERETFVAQEKLAELAQRDFLTGLLNRRAFAEYASRGWRFAAREKKSAAVLMFDVDHFKAFNDHYGHAAGDCALQLVARELGAHSMRPLDTAARYGGEEFIGLWVDIDSDEILALAERIRCAVLALAVPHLFSDVAPVVTISIGISYHPCAQAGELEAAQRSADDALYLAKKSGRNCAVLAA